MPKYTLDLKLLSPEDQDSVGQIFARHLLLRNSFLETRNGFIVDFSAFNQNFSEILPKLSSFLVQNTTAENLHRQVKDLQKILLPQISLDTKLTNEIKSKLSHLKSPFLIQAITKDIQGKEGLTFETTAKNLTEVNKAVINSWASFINKDNIQKGTFNNLSVAVCITEKNLPDYSGRAFILGGGEGLIEIQTQWGEYNPTEKSDILHLNRKTLAEESYLINPQKKQLVYKNHKFEAIGVSEKYQNERKLSSDAAEKIAKALKKIQSEVLTSVEVGFEVVDNKIILNDVNLNIDKGQKSDKFHISIDLPTLENLKPIVPGLVSGFAKLIENPRDLKKLRSGDIAILKSFNKEYLQTLKKASGIIVQNSQSLTDEVLPHLKSLGITTAVGKLNTLPKQLITLNGKTGKLYLGAFSPLKEATLNASEIKPEVKTLKTATKVFLSLTNASTEGITPGNFDGIGPVRPELFFTRFGIHPKELLNKSQFHQVEDGINSHFSALCKLAGDKPVIYQLSDFKTAELIPLDHGLQHEIPETNPFLGKRGAFRHLLNPDLLEAELTMVKKLRNNSGFKNLWVSLSFVRTKNELAELKKLISKVGLNRSSSFKLLMTISTPANIYSVDKLIAEGIDGFLIDYYDLANLVYGKDFSYAELVNLDDNAIDNAITTILKITAKNKLFSNIYNFPIEKSHELFKKVVDLGIKSVSISENQVNQARNDLAEMEKQLVQKNAP